MVNWDKSRNLVPAVRLTVKLFVPQYLALSLKPIISPIPAQLDQRPCWSSRAMCNAIVRVVAGRPGSNSLLSRARIMRAREDGDEWPADQVERWPLTKLIPYARNARTHSDEQIKQIAASIRGPRSRASASCRCRKNESFGTPDRPDGRSPTSQGSPGQAVYEPFSGSGTTIIAAEMPSRVCHAIEIAPAYVDVAVKRWQEFTGTQAVLDGDGRSFDTVAAQRPR
jgi:hypothetical protein